MQTIISKCDYCETIHVLKNKYNMINEKGNFFAIFSTEYDENGDVLHDFFDVITEAVQIGYQYVNTIVYPTKEVQNVAFKDNVRYIVWLCINRDMMIFDKDSIREKHIWKDVEWGKREKNYNPKGKDPGNVWIPTEDNGRAVITKHILLSDEEVISKLLLMSMCYDDYEIITDDVSKTELKSLAVEANEKANTKAKIIFSSSEDMGDISNGSIRIAITSPPYWDLKDYYKAGQIGQEAYDEYLARIETVWKNVFCKLKPNGSLWININIRVREGKVIIIPKDIVSMCKRIGYHYKGIVVWHKSSGIPTSNKNIVDRHEYILVFSKDEKFSVDYSRLEAIRDYKNEDINGCAFWNINRKAGSVGKKYIHPAIYPNELARRIVVLASSSRETILDPFLGSGTTVIAACNTYRNCIGYEYYEGFRELMESRFENELNDTEVEYVIK